jgi:hypothetical protein
MVARPGSRGKSTGKVDIAWRTGEVGESGCTRLWPLWVDEGFVPLVAGEKRLLPKHNVPGPARIITRVRELWNGPGSGRCKSVAGRVAGSGLPSSTEGRHSC